MEKPELVYVTYIRTTAENLWAAITKPEFTRIYWAGNVNLSEWKKGAKWQHVDGDDRNDVLVVGEVLECLPPKRLVLTWADPDNEADVSRVSFELEPMKDTVCLTVKHGGFKPGSDMSTKVSGGWPRVLSSMKSFLETGQSLNLFGGCNG